MMVRSTGFLVGVNRCGRFDQPLERFAAKDITGQCLFLTALLQRRHDIGRLGSRRCRDGFHRFLDVLVGDFDSFDRGHCLEEDAVDKATSACSRVVAKNVS